MKLPSVFWAPDIVLWRKGLRLIFHNSEFFSLDHAYSKILAKTHLQNLNHLDYPRQDPGLGEFNSRASWLWDIPEPNLGWLQCVKLTPECLVMENKRSLQSANFDLQNSYFGIDVLHNYDGVYVTA